MIKLAFAAAVAATALAGALAAATPATADDVPFHAFGVHGGTIDDSVPGTITAITGNDANYHWNKSSWETRTGQKAFYNTSAFNGMPVSTILSLSWDVTTGYWGNAYFNVMVTDGAGHKAILAPSSNTALSPGWGDMGATKSYSVFEAELGWVGTTSVGWYAATWNEVKDLIITDGPFTEFPDTLDGAATAPNDPVYTVDNWAAWADQDAGSDQDWEKGGFMITFGQSTGTATPTTTIENVTITHEPIPPVLSCELGGFEPPFDEPLTLKSKSKRAIPVKMVLIDYWGTPFTDEDVTAPPVVTVSYSPDPVDNGSNDSELVPSGLSDDGNAFRFDLDSQQWIINLATKQFTSPGQYTVTAVAGDPSYNIDGSCSGIFNRLP